MVEEEDKCVNSLTEFEAVYSMPYSHALCETIKADLVLPNCTMLPFYGIDYGILHSVS